MSDFGKRSPLQATHDSAEWNTTDRITDNKYSFQPISATSECKPSKVIYKKSNESLRTKNNLILTNKNRLIIIRRIVALLVAIKDGTQR